MSYADYGHNVRTLRQRQGLSQAQLGERAGCTPTTICKQEGSRNGAGLCTAARIAQALGVTVDTLIGPRLSPV